MLRRKNVLRAEANTWKEISFLKRHNLSRPMHYYGWDQCNLNIGPGGTLARSPFQKGPLHFIINIIFLSFMKFFLITVLEKTIVFQAVYKNKILGWVTFGGPNFKIARACP